MKHLTHVYVDLQKFKHNIQTIKKHLPKNTLYCAVLKGDAYGHGIKNLAPAAIQAGSEFIAVVDNWEAAAVRDLGLNCQLIRLRPALEDEIYEAVDWQVQELCGNINDAERVSKVGNMMAKKIPIHLKVDVGIGRMGFACKSLDQMVSDIAKNLLPLSGINIVGLMCHFPNADEPDISVTLNQLEKFKHIVSQLKPLLNKNVLIHVENSAATLRFEKHFNLARVGLAGYGLKVGGAQNDQIRLEPVMTWKSRVVQVRTMPAGSTIGYGMTYRCSKDTKVATLPFGYADGYSRTLSNNADVLIHGKRCPVVGRISMNLVIVDVSNLDHVQPGDEVVMIGKQGSEKILLDELADQGNMLNYELACLIGKCNDAIVT